MTPDTPIGRALSARLTDPDELAELRAFVVLVEKLRGRQKQFFKTGDRAIMSECRDLERRVDELARKLSQPSLPFDPEGGAG